MAKSISRNNALRKRALNFFSLILLGILLCLILFQGCVLTDCQTITPETDNLKAGEEAFFQKNYSEAATIFNLILSKSDNGDIRNIALYNLACTKLNSSENEDDLNEAIQLLSNWSPSKNRSMQLENPLLLVQAFQKLQLKQSKRLYDINTIVKKQNKKIIKMKKVIQTLQHQITELENIDKEIQEKRKIIE